MTFERELSDAIPTLLRYAMRKGLSHHAAEDAVQDVMLRAVRNRAAYTVGTNATAWCLTMLKQVLINGYRDRVCHMRRVEALAEHTLCIEGSRALPQEEAMAVSEVLELMPASDRAALCAVGLGHKREEAAALLGITMIQLDHRVALGRSRLRAVLQ